MFKISKTPRFTHDVPIEVPVDDGHATQTLRTTYEVLDDDEYESFDTRTVEGLKSLLTRIVHRLDDIEDEDGKALPYSDELKARMLELPYIRIGLIRGYNAAMLGARAGN